jgi:hypothetical protein
MRLLRSLFTVLAVFGSVYGQSLPSGQPPTAHSIDSPPDLALPSSVYVKVRLDKSIKVSALKPGDVIQGNLAQDVYSGDRELFPANSLVRLTVDKLARRRRTPNDHWPWVVKAFTPRHENYPTFQTGVVSLPDGKEVPLRVSLIFINRETQVLAQGKTKKKKGNQPAAGSATPAEDASAPQVASPGEAESKTAESSVAPAKVGPKDDSTFVILEAADPTETASAAAAHEFALPGPVTLAAGTRAKIILLGGVSASKSHPGDTFQARLVEPVRLNSRVVLPEGTLVGG